MLAITKSVISSSATGAAPAGASSAFHRAFSAAISVPSARLVASSTGAARNRSMAYVPSAMMFRAPLDRLVRSLGPSCGSVARR